MDTGHQYFLTVDSATNSLYLSLPLRRQIWQVLWEKAFLGLKNTLSQNYQIIAGDGGTCADSSTNSNTCGDGGLAKNAQLAFPKGKFNFKFS